MVGVWLLVLASSLILHGKALRLIVRKTNRLTQAVVFFRRHFLCSALLCNCSSAEREGLSTHLQRECAAEPFTRSILSLRIFTSLPDRRLRFFIAMQINSTPLCVCVCFLPIHSGHQWTYQPGSHRIFNPPSFCGACLNFSRKKDSDSSSTVKSNFVY